jgi:hypothetical protein
LYSRLGMAVAVHVADGDARHVEQELDVAVDEQRPGPLRHEVVGARADVEQRPRLAGGRHERGSREHRHHEPRLRAELAVDHAQAIETALVLGGRERGPVDGQIAPRQARVREGQDRETVRTQEHELRSRQVRDVAHVVGGAVLGHGHVVLRLQGELPGLVLGPHADAPALGRRRAREDDLQEIGAAVAVEVGDLGRDGAAVTRDLDHLERVVVRLAARDVRREPECGRHEREQPSREHAAIVAEH